MSPCHDPLSFPAGMSNMLGMSSSRHVYKRQMRLLCELAKTSEYVVDKAVSLKTLVGAVRIQPRMVAGSVNSPARFLSDPDNESSEKGRYRTTDLIALADAGYVKPHQRSDDPCAVVTTAGIAKVTDFERSWLSKAIDKQPMTFLQVLLTVFLLLCDLGLAIWTGRLSNTVHRLNQINPATQPAQVSARGG